MLVEDLDAQLWSRQDDESDDVDEEAVCEALARPMTASCVDSAVLRSTGSAAAGGEVLNLEMEVDSPCSPEAEALSPAGAAVVSPAHAVAPPQGASSKKVARSRRHGGSMGMQASCGAEVARLLVASRSSGGQLSERLRDYAAGSRGGFGRVPAAFVPGVAALEGEERYILSLIEPHEAPRERVRLLAKGEKERRLRELRQQVHQATAIYSQAKPRSKTKANAQAELTRLREEVAFHEQPYVFLKVEAPTGRSPAPQAAAKGSFAVPTPPKEGSPGKSPRPSPRPPLRQQQAASSSSSAAALR